MSAHWNSYPTAEEAAEACSRHILALLENALSGEGDATLALSGGTTPKRLFQLLAAARFDWGHVHLFWVDERAVPPTDAQSNYRLANESLIIPAHIPQRNVHRIAGELPPDKAAKRYEREISDFFELNAGELPHFDIMHFGTGPDAHTASLFPGEPLLDNRDGIAAPVFADRIGQWRVTLLPGVLLAARHSVFLAAGADKADVLRDVFLKPYDPKQFPAQMISHHGRKVTWFLDQEAARFLN
ncbi:MAG: 6-phosphogluconolactonase [Bryobacteraceae bacterium]